MATIDFIQHIESKDLIEIAIQKFLKGDFFFHPDYRSEDLNFITREKLHLSFNTYDSTEPMMNVQINGPQPKGNFIYSIGQKIESPELIKRIWHKIDELRVQFKSEEHLKETKQLKAWARKYKLIPSASKKKIKRKVS